MQPHGNFAWSAAIHTPCFLCLRFSTPITLPPVAQHAARCSCDASSTAPPPADNCMQPPPPPLPRAGYPHGLLGDLPKPFGCCGSLVEARIRIHGCACSAAARRLNRSGCVTADVLSADSSDRCTPRRRPRPPRDLHPCMQACRRATSGSGAATPQPATSRPPAFGPPAKTRSSRRGCGRSRRRTRTAPRRAT